MNKVTVRINGSEYPVVGEKSESYMLSIGKHVNDEMTKAITNNPKLSTSQAAVLAAINITDHLFECAEENDVLLKEKEELNKKIELMEAESKLELKKLQLKIDQLANNTDENNKSMEDLLASIDEKSKEVDNLNQVIMNKADEISSYKSEIDELKRLLEEAKIEADVSQKMCSKFQNDAYKVQLEKIEIENELKFYVAKG